MNYKPFYCVVLALTLASYKLAAQKLNPGPQVATFHSDLDDTEQPYGLYIPQNYDPLRKYPLVVMLHGAGSNHRLALRRVFGKSNMLNENDVEASRYFPEFGDVEYFVISPYARGTAGYQGIPEQDVYDALADARKRFTIDENRIYLTGLSMGGGGTLWLGLTRPDIWAAIAPVCPAPPQGTLDLVKNARNYSVHFFHGDKDQAVPVESTRIWVSKMQELGIEVTYKEFEGVNHNSWENAYDGNYIFSWFDDYVRDPYPDKVWFSTKYYRYNRAFWVKLDKISEGKVSGVEANFLSENIIDVKTSNLERFTIDLRNHPKFNAKKPVSITIDGPQLKFTTDSVMTFEMTKSGWVVVENKALPIFQKSVSMAGPLSEVFASRHIYVYGTADNPDKGELKRRQEIAVQAANWSYYRGEFLGRVMFFPRVVADKDVRKSDISDCNMVLFGTKETNRIIADNADILPMHLDSAAKDYGLFYVYPIKGKLVAINSGVPWWVKESETQSFIDVGRLSKLKDFVIYHSSMDHIKVHHYFSPEWKPDEEAVLQIKKLGIISINSDK